MPTAKSELPEAQAKALEAFFKNALHAYLVGCCDNAPLAALAAIMTAGPKQRAEMESELQLQALRYEKLHVQLVATRTRRFFPASDPALEIVAECAPMKLNMLRGLLDDFDWTRQAIADFKKGLHQRDPEYASALEAFDHSVFKRRFPTLF
jgi:hypothetical protein